MLGRTKVKKILIVLMLCLIPNLCLAQVYELNDIKLKVNIPDGYYVVTRNTQDASLFKHFGDSRDNILNKMKKQSIFLSAMKNDHRIEIGICYTDNETFSKFEDTKNDPKSIASQEYKDSYRKIHKDKFGVTTETFEVYDTNSALYSRVGGFTNVNGRKYYVQNFDTIRNGKMFAVTVAGLYTDKALVAKEGEAIVNSLVYMEPSIEKKKNIDINRIAWKIGTSVAWGGMIAFILRPFLSFLKKIQK